LESRAEEFLTLSRRRI